MPTSNDLKQYLMQALEGIGVSVTALDIQTLDNAHGALMIHVVSPAFENQTFLDREMRVRPAVARAFALAGHPPTEPVLDLLSPDEMGTETPSLVATIGPTTLDDQERASRHEWRETRKAVLSVLRASRYLLEALEEDRVYVATRPGLAAERILLGFASSPRTTTVDLEVRTAMETARQADSYQSSYYLAPSELEAPFANQKPARWLSVITTATFLHLLDSSKTIAERSRAEAEGELSVTKELSGKVIEPACIADGEESVEPFFGRVDQWLELDTASLLVLMAPAGHGKTTLTLELTRRLASNFIVDEKSWLPVFVPFQSVRRTVDFEALLHRRLAELDGSSYAAYSELLKRGRAVLVVDGFDELADDAGMQAAENQVRSIRSLLQGKAKILLAGRTAFATQFGGDEGVGQRMRSLLGDVNVSVLNVRRFDRDQVAQYVETRIGLAQQQQTDVLRFCDTSPDHEELCSSPLLLRLICGLAHSGALPTASDDAPPTIDALLEGVCRREEDRQHLGLGVEHQMEYLGELAVEQFKRGEPTIRTSDAALLVEFLPTEAQTRNTELVGRLLDHALLTTKGPERLAFLHPLIRDSILARVIDHRLRASETLATALRACGADMRDLPEASIRWLAMTDRALGSAPPEWLSNQKAMASGARRNVLRIALRAASRSDNPRQWWSGGWAAGGVVSHMDMSALTFKSRSFDGMIFDTCMMDGSVFADCDFRSSKIDGCSFLETVFISCRVSAATEIVRSLSRGAVVYGDDEGTVVDSGDDLVKALGVPTLPAPTVVPHETAMPPAESPTRRAARVRESVMTLFRGVLRSLVDDDGTRFHRVPLEELSRMNLQDREKRVVEKVIVPTVLTAFCSSELRRGSREVVFVDTRWKAALASYVQTNRMSHGLQDVVAEIVARSARYLD